MQVTELAALSEIVSGVIRKAVAKAKDELREEFRREMDARAAGITALEPIIDEGFIRREIKKAIDSLPPVVPVPGKDADPEFVRATVSQEVAKAIAQLPPPQNGKDAEPVNLDDVVTQVLGKIPAPCDGKDGADGKSVDPDILRAQIIALIPTPKDGRDGTDGKDVDPEYVRSFLQDEAAKVAAALPIPRDGKDGRDGLDGKDGLNGTVGIDGKDGERGLPGKDAEPVDIEKLADDIFSKIRVPIDGAPGKDVDPEAVRELVHAEVMKAVEALPKPKDGLPGKDGESIHQDTVRLMVLDEVQKAVGAIRVPEDGKDGLPGRDALEPYILPSLNPSKSYPAGTVGAHAGGTIRALKQTTIGDSLDMSEWLVLLNGTALETMDWGDDAGTIVFEKTYTNGTVLRKELNYPAMGHQGIFREGESYRKGHTVTSGSSTWLCNVTGTKAKPGLPPHDHWTLIAKAIRGKDGKDGLPGKEGPPGRPGKDLTQLGYDGSKY